MSGVVKKAAVLVSLPSRVERESLRPDALDVTQKILQYVPRNSFSRREDEVAARVLKKVGAKPPPRFPMCFVVGGGRLDSKNI